ncbi:unnamed protein product [Periconia digitata]|uniref:Uncharacterized protein n=1 Tax=Periconia digitata TaxID=1303443 RepID=A0A9W4U8B2_9PLEO|nr:unnamed protein product [Periconia digitata]
MFPRKLAMQSLSFGQGMNKITDRTFSIRIQIRCGQPHIILRSVSIYALNHTLQHQLIFAGFLVLPPGNTVSAILLS